MAYFLQCKAIVFNRTKYLTWDSVVGLSKMTRQTSCGKRKKRASQSSLLLIKDPCQPPQDTTLTHITSDVFSTSTNTTGFSEMTSPTEDTSVDSYTEKEHNAHNTHRTATHVSWRGHVRVFLLAHWKQSHLFMQQKTRGKGQYWHIRKLQCKKQHWASTHLTVSVLLEIRERDYQTTPTHTNTRISETIHINLYGTLTHTRTHT